MKNEESHITCLVRWSDDCEQVGIHFEWNPILWFFTFFVSVVTEGIKSRSIVHWIALCTKIIIPNHSLKIDVISNVKSITRLCFDKKYAHCK